MSRTRTSCPRAISALDRYASPALCVTYLCAPAGSISNTLIYYLRVDVEQSIDISGCGELFKRAFLSFLAHCAAQPVIDDELIQTICVLSNVQMWNEESRLAVLQP